jgi:MFS family permease
MKRVQVSKNVILAIVGVAQLMDILDMAIVNVALPSIFRELRFVPPDPAQVVCKRVDLVGASLVTGGLLLVVYALTQAPARGWGSRQSITGLAGGAALLVGFALHEARTPDPLVPFDILRVRNLAAGNIA